MVATTPPAGFDALTATAAELQEYGFPARPTDPTDLAAWEAMMQNVSSDTAPTGDLELNTADTGTSPSGDGAFYGSWGGYAGGNFHSNRTAHTAVEGDFTVPSADGCRARGLPLGIWVGLGGTGGGGLVQAGISCGSDYIPGNGFRPFLEFVPDGSIKAVPFCGQQRWVLGTGNTVYTDVAYYAYDDSTVFFMDDLTTNVKHSCTRFASSSQWHFGGNTAEWVVEAPHWDTVPFTRIYFRDTQALNTVGNWVKLGDEADVTKMVTGQAPRRTASRPRLSTRTGCGSTLPTTGHPANTLGLRSRLEADQR